MPDDRHHAAAGKRQRHARNGMAAPQPGGTGTPYRQDT